MSEQAKTIDLYFQPILEDLIVHLTSNLWRNRESSCMALCDLLRGRTLEAALDKMDPCFEAICPLEAAESNDVLVRDESDANAEENKTKYGDRSMHNYKIELG